MVSKLSAMDKPFFRYWQACYMALYSRRLYIDVCKRWRGLGVGYLALLIFIASIPMSVKVVLQFNQYFDQQLIAPVRQLPDIYIQNGRMSLDKPMPYVIRNEAREVVALVDNQATQAESFRFYPHLVLLINDTHIYFRPPTLQLFKDAGSLASNERVFDDALANTGDGLFNGEDWVNDSGVTHLKWITDLLVFPALAIFFFSIYLSTMLGVIVLSQGYSWVIFKLKLKFKEASRLCLTALTAQVMIFFTCLTLGIHIPWMGTAQVVLFVAYFSFAALVVKKERKQLVHA